MNTVVVTALVCHENKNEETGDTRDTVIAVTCPSESLVSGDSNETQGHVPPISAGNRRMRTSSLPDILEEDLVTNIS